jgi:hypothetical protein
MIETNLAVKILYVARAYEESSIRKKIPSGFKIEQAVIDGGIEYTSKRIIETTDLNEIDIFTKLYEISESVLMDAYGRSKHIKYFQKNINWNCGLKGNYILFSLPIMYESSCILFDCEIDNTNNNIKLSLSYFIE